MAYDENLAERVRGILKRCKGVSEKKMFGGLTFNIPGQRQYVLRGRKTTPDGAY